jgi:hypothetical protein
MIEFSLERFFPFTSTKGFFMSDSDSEITPPGVIPTIVLTNAQGKFPLGRLTATPGALNQISVTDISIALSRHHAGDWGDCDAHDRAANNLALKEGTRLFSVYHSSKSIKFWIITEADRSLTCILLPHEY